MRARTWVTRGAAVAAAGVVVGWPAWAAVAWARYGHARRGDGRETPLDRFMPEYDVAEEHETRVAAPAELAYAAATGTGLQESALVRGIFHAREWIMRVGGEDVWPPGGLVAQLQSWGWGVLADAPGREVVLGAVTQPWHGDVRFRALPPDEFAAFDEPGFVKIVTTVAAEPAGPDASVLRTRTRAVATGAEARAQFRRYWAAFSPGIVLVRRLLLRTAKREAERRHRASPASAAAPRGGG